MFFVIVLTIWLCIHLYAGWRLIGPLDCAPSRKRILWMCVAALYLLLPAVIVLRMMDGKPAWYGVLFWATFIIAGYTLMVLPLLVVKDAVSIALKPFALARRFFSSGETMDPPANPGRRTFLVNAVNGGVLGLAGGMAAAGFPLARKTPGVVNITIPLRGLSPALDGFTIAQITDTHVSDTIGEDYIRAIVERTNGLSPDLICFTGDMVDGLVSEMRRGVAPFARLRARHGVYFVTGNHEYYWDLDGWLNETQRLNMKLLINSHNVITHDGGRILLAGVTDYTAGRHVPSHASDPGKAVRGAPPADVRIMLAHQPKSAPAVANTGADLMLCGHTHGGQFFPYNLVVPFFQPINPGLHLFDGMWVYVSRGSGYWGPPYRLGAPSEITHLTLRNSL